MAGRSYPDLELISLWFSRSKSLPLSFTVTQRSESSQTQEKTLQVLNLLTEQIPRWRDARLYLAGAEPRKILSIVNAHALLLEHFEMKTFQQNVPDGEFLYRVFEHPVPKLTKLAISAIPHADFWRDPAAGHIPWHQLTSLTIDFVTVPSAVGVLRDCHILQNCILGLQSSTHSAGLLASTSPLIHGTLEVLELEAERDDLTLFLDYTLIPALDVLTIHGKGSGNTEYWPQAHLEDHLERSGARPRVLSIRTGWLHGPDSHLFFQHQGIQLELEAERDDLTLFLDYTLIPALDVLTIHGKGSGNTEYWPQAHLEDHLERSGSRPRVLSIRTGWLHEPDSHLFFQHQGIQDLVELKILDELDWSHSNSSWFTHAVLESLTPGRCENVSLPKLEILEFRGYLVGIRASDILRFVESRWRCGGGGGESLGTSRLKATCLMDSSRMFFKCTEEERRICLQLRREGMDLVLTSEE
ncbi:hypothetical protein DXG03_003198 [Asterophora parasitica]|uniref:Uncharacterized protein n=1 Tax=Asterophora parasitica TaxID=117018 RepID=A0A9P7GDI7_9AGAR|nr:hypothetical protein DXG03_003198 [Asterophora parasitica]